MRWPDCHHGHQQSKARFPQSRLLLPFVDDTCYGTATKLVTSSGCAKGEKSSAWFWVMAFSNLQQRNRYNIYNYGTPQLHSRLGPNVKPYYCPVFNKTQSIFAFQQIKCTGKLQRKINYVQVNWLLHPSLKYYWSKREDGGLCAAVKTCLYPWEVTCKYSLVCLWCGKML